MSVQGPQAVGKTSVLRSIQKRRPEVTFLFENPQPLVVERDARGLDISTKQGFIENQRLFIEAELHRWQSLGAGCFVFDRGPEDTECYTRCYPIVTRNDWDVERELATELEALKCCRPERLLYMKARGDILIKRRENDRTRARRSFDLTAFEIYEDWYLRNLNVDVLDVSDLDPEEVEATVEEWIMAWVA